MCIHCTLYNVQGIWGEALQYIKVVHVLYVFTLNSTVDQLLGRAVATLCANRQDRSTGREMLGYLKFDCK